MSDDWCDLCELPRSTCVHGRPPTEPVAVRRTPPAARAPRARKVAAPRATSGARVTVRQSAKRITPSASFRPHIVAVLTEHGGSLEVEPLMDALHGRMADVLLEDDHQVVEGGEVRWRRTARMERASMSEDGLLVPGRALGIWQLS